MSSDSGELSIFSKSASSDFCNPADNGLGGFSPLEAAISF
jgi:hypothetical protein